MSIYDEMQNVVREILGDPEFKQGSTHLVKVTPGTGPVDDPGPATRMITPIDGAVRGVKWSYVNIGLAVASDLQITHSVVPGVVPVAGDKVIADGIEYHVKTVQPLPAAGTPVAYVLILSR